MPAADLRIDELRKIDLRIDTSNLPSVTKIELEMTDSDFIWGAMVDNYMEDEAGIQRLSRTLWLLTGLLTHKLRVITCEL